MLSTSWRHLLAAAQIAARDAQVHAALIEAEHAAEGIDLADAGGHGRIGAARHVARAATVAHGWTIVAVLPAAADGLVHAQRVKLAIATERIAPAHAGGDGAVATAAAAARGAAIVG